MGRARRRGRRPGRLFSLPGLGSGADLSNRASILSQARRYGAVLGPGAAAHLDHDWLREKPMRSIMVWPGLFLQGWQEHDRCVPPLVRTGPLVMVQSSRSADSLIRRGPG